MNAHFIQRMKDFKIIYGKTVYYFRKDFLSVRSQKIQNLKGNELLVPEADGPFENFLKFLQFQIVDVCETNAYFLFCMSKFFQLKNHRLEEFAFQFWESDPTDDEIKVILNILGQENAEDLNFLGKYSKRIVLYLNTHPEALSPSIATIIIRNIKLITPYPIIYRKFLTIMLDNLKNNPTQEYPIAQFIEKCIDEKLYGVVLEYPYFDINQIPFFMEAFCNFLKK